MNKLAVIHTISSLDSKNGGPPRSVADLCNELIKYGVVVTIISRKLKKDNLKLNINSRASLVFVESGISFAFRGAMAINREVIDLKSKGYNVFIHNHGVWTIDTILSYIVSKVHGVPWGVHIRGALSEWALGQKRLKKAVALYFYQRHILDRAKLIFATSEKESNEIKLITSNRNILVISNFSQTNLVNPSELSLSRSGPFTFGFLGRIQKVKNIHSFLKALIKTQEKNGILSAVKIAGPIEDPVYMSDLKNLCASYLGPVDFLGELNSCEKMEFFEAIDVLFLPSFTENFGNVVVEALSHSVPVLVSDKTPWANVEENKVGWVSSTDSESLAIAISKINSLSNLEIRIMKSNCHNYLIKEKVLKADVKKYIDVIDCLR